VLGGPALYAAMGGVNGSLSAALAYSNTLFGAAVLIWLFNSLANVIRGTGNMFLPAAVVCAGAAILIPVSPVLIFGFGFLPRLGIVGGAVAIIAYYAIGSAIFAYYIWWGRGVLRPALRPPRLDWPPAYEILRIGAVASLVSITTNLTIAVATGLVGAQGPAAVAGYGTGVRLEYLLIPLAFGLGAPLVAMVGTAIGAGRRERALRAAWIGAAIAFAITEAIGIWAALFPHAWLTLFGDDPTMLAVGAQYLRIVGPFYGLFGGGMALYFASQGAGRLGWPLLAGLLRLAVATAGGWLALRLGGSVTGVFVALGVALAVFGLVNAGAVAFGAWFRGAPQRS
jgi:Na+-driven multidrug efflux pump